MPCIKCTCTLKQQQLIAARIGIFEKCKHESCDHPLADHNNLEATAPAGAVLPAAWTDLVTKLMSAEKFKLQFPTNSDSMAYHTVKFLYDDDRARDPARLDEIKAADWARIFAGSTNAQIAAAREVLVPGFQSAGNTFPTCIEFPAAPSKSKWGTHAGVAKIAQFSLTKPPLTVIPHPSAKYVRPADTVQSWSDESTYRAAKQDILHPKTMEHVGNVSAHTLWPSIFSGEMNAYPVLPSAASLPELGWRPKQAHLAHVSAAYELKTFSHEGLMELASGAVGDIVYGFFNTPADCWKFFDVPPRCVCFPVCASAVVAVFIAELVGTLHFSLFAGAFNLGDPSHHEIINYVDKLRKAECVVDLKSVRLKKCDILQTSVQWTTAPVGKYFYKVLLHDRFQVADKWRDLYAIYKTVGTHFCVNQDIDVRHPELPAALEPARLIYGNFQVAVQMKFIEGDRLTTLSDLSEEQENQIVDALVFLARNELLYTDLRPQNIIVSSDGTVHLIDYDDIQSCSARDLMETLTKPATPLWQKVADLLAKRHRHL